MPAYSKISIITPTLNSASVLSTCLRSIRTQNYPQNKIEILIIDGGSTDNTLQIAKKFSCKVFKNPLKTAEAGKAVGVKHSTGDYLVFIDSDNILPNKSWLKKMISPFNSSPEIIGSEPIRFTYRRSGGFIERYSSLFGTNDPYTFFLGNYDRQNHLNNRWTGLDIPTINFKDYLLINILSSSSIPTIGANGTVFKSNFLKNNFNGDYLFDIDIITSYIQKTKEPIWFAKVKIGIIHTYCESSISKFIRKQSRRVKDIFFYQKIRTYQWQPPTNHKNILFLAYSFLFFPPLIQAIQGYLRKQDPAWFFHPIACFITAATYSTNTVIHLLGFSTYQDRNRWHQ